MQYYYVIAEGIGVYEVWSHKDNTLVMTVVGKENARRLCSGKTVEARYVVGKP